jgi:hypothetical protein
MRTYQPVRRRGVVAAVAAALAVTGLAACGNASDPETTPVPEPTVLGEQVFALDLGAVPDEEALSVCSSPKFAKDGPVEVLYGVRQATEDGAVPVVLLRNDEGDLRLCDVEGPDSPSQYPVPVASEAQPVVFLTNGRAAWDCTGQKLERYTSTTWLAVGPEVATVEQRFVVDGAEGPWFSTEPVDGYAHLQTWEVGPLPKRTDLTVETRVLDAEGEPVPQDALPVGAREVGWCEDGDVEIG